MKKLWAASLLVVALCVPAQAGALQYAVIGDSIALDWPEVAFGVDVTNNAVGGATSKDFLDVCSPEACWWKTGLDPGTVVWFELAHNDAALGTAVEIVWGYQYDLIQEIFSTGVYDVRLIFTIDMIDVFGIDRSAQRAKLAEIQAEQQLLCDAIIGLYCVLELNPLFAGDPSLYLTDGIHPNAAGVAVIAEAVVLVPEPSTSLLMKAGLLGLLVAGSRRKRCQTIP